MTTKKDEKKPLSALEKFQAAIAIFVSLTTAFIGFKTYQLNEVAGINNERLKQIELRLSERKMDFEQSKDIYDRVEKYLLSDQDIQRGRALLILVSVIPESAFRASLLSMLTVESKQEAVATAAAETYIGGALPASEKSARFEGEILLEAGSGASYTLLKGFSFVDSNGKSWNVPKGFVFTGASVPRIAWSAVAPTGPSVGAFVLYEYMVTHRSAPSSDVSQVFYQALLAEGVPLAQARVLYVAVQTFAPTFSADP